MKSITRNTARKFVAVRTAFQAAAFIAVTHVWAMLTAFADTVSGARPLPALARARSSRRAAGMLEYALIALIAVGIFVLLRDFFGRLFGRLTGDIEKKIDAPNNSGL